MVFGLDLVEELGIAAFHLGRFDVGHEFEVEPGAGDADVGFIGGNGGDAEFGEDAGGGLCAEDGGAFECGEEGFDVEMLFGVGLACVGIVGA